MERRYDAIWPRIRERLLVEADKVAGGRDVEFVLVGLDIAATPGPDVEWELSYEPRPASRQFTVSLLNWEPREVVSEC